MNTDLWQAKKVIDSTLHPGRHISMKLYTYPRTTANTQAKDTGEAVFLPFRMSCFVLSNLVVTVGMLTPNLGVSFKSPIHPAIPSPSKISDPLIHLPHHRQQAH